MALGTKSKVRGRKYGIHRPDLVINDDLENSDMVRSEAEREWIRYQWFDKDLMHIHGEKGTFTDILVVGTILGKESLLYKLLDPSEYPDWTSRKFKAVQQFSESPLWDQWEGLYKDRFDENRIDTARKFFSDNKDEMLEGTEVLWPEGDPYYDLMIDKISNYSAFLSEKQNNPLDESRILVPLKDLRFENFAQGWIQDIIKNKRNPRYGALDPSLGKKNKKGDYSCITVIIRDLKSGYILVHVLDLKRRSVEDQIESILKYHQKYKYKLFAVETNAFQLVVADTLRKYSRRSGLYVPVKDVIVKSDKKMRFEKHIPIIKDGTVIFDSLKYNNNNTYFKSIEQITTFIGDGKDAHDDAVDSLTLSLDLITQRVFKRRTKQNR
jgi:predicted phage terminase large subunit-like protein